MKESFWVTYKTTSSQSNYTSTSQLWRRRTVQVNLYAELFTFYRDKVRVNDCYCTVKVQLVFSGEFSFFERYSEVVKLLACTFTLLSLRSERGVARPAVPTSLTSSSVLFFESFPHFNFLCSPQEASVCVCVLEVLNGPNSVIFYSGFNFAQRQW